VKLADHPLPAVVNTIQEVAGLAMRQVCKAFGGTTIYIPERPGADEQAGQGRGARGSAQHRRGAESWPGDDPAGPQCL
jgi:hypothetical protein